MKIAIDTDGGREELELDLDIENLTMRESVRLEELLGSEVFDRMMSQEISELEMARPSFMRALLFSKLKTQRPDLEIDGFDLDLGELLEELGGQEAEELPKVGEQSSG